MGHLPHWPRAGQAERPCRPFALGTPGLADAPPPPTPPPRRAAPELERSLQFLQEQHGETLRQLHQEIDRLKRRNQDLQYRLIMQPLLQQAGFLSADSEGASASRDKAKRAGGGPGELAGRPEGRRGGYPGGAPGGAARSLQPGAAGGPAERLRRPGWSVSSLEGLGRCGTASFRALIRPRGQLAKEPRPFRLSTVRPSSGRAAQELRSVGCLRARSRAGFPSARPADRWKEEPVPPPEAAQGLASSGLCPASVATYARVCERAPRRLPPVADAKAPEQKAGEGEPLAEEEAAPEGTPEWERDAGGLSPEPQAAAAAAAAAAAPGRDIVAVCERRMSPLSLPRPSASQSRDGDVRIPAASSNPFLVNVLPSYMRKPPSLEECEVVIRQLWNINHMQMQELMYLRSCLDDIHKTKRIPEDYMLAGQLGSQESTKLPRMRNAPKKCRILTPLPAAERAVLPALKQTLGNAFAERQKRAQAVQRNRLHRTAL
ncbi:coiled-coil domain-containing protein 74B-like [Crotalus adamanteus]|uniref:Coiled-coil domain-containing protein 74B-like n=1 Tax=Crotalus adamanteus TaxID=8729 RepID=A0AAW1ANT1_CROAD